MNHRTLSRLIAAALMVVIIATAMNINHVRLGHRGRDAYLSEQALKFDRYYAAPNFGQPVLESLLGCAAFLFLYELIAANTLKILTILGRLEEKGNKPGTK